MNEENNEQEELNLQESEDITPEVESSEQEPEQQNEVKVKAKSTGHLTKEEYVARGGKPEDYKTEKEYVLTGELIELKKAVQKRDRDIEDILKYHQNTIEAQKINFKKQIEERLYQAKSNGDIDQVEQITREKYEVEQRENQQNQANIQKQIQMAISTFTQRNAHWYNPQHQDLVDRAVELEKDIISGRYQDETGIPQPKDYEGVLKQIELAMKVEAPDIVPTRGVSRPSISSSKSSVNMSVASASDTSDNVLYGKLKSEEQSMYKVLRRMAEKTGMKYSVKEFIEKSRRDQEI